MQREFVVDGEVFKCHEYFYCVNCETRVARIEDYVPNVRDLLYGGYFTNLSHVVIIDQPKFLRHEDGNNLTTAQIYCLQCNDQIGWRLISASRQTDYFMEGRYFMRFEKLMFQNRVTVRSYIIGSAYREGLIQAGGANAQVGGTNAQVIGGVNARIGGVVQPIKGANAQVRRVNAQVGGASAQAIGGTNAQTIGGTNTQVIGGVNAQVRRATGHPLLVLNEEQVGEANDPTLLYLNEEPVEEANETGPNDEDGAQRLDLNEEPVEEANETGPNYSDEDGAPRLDLNMEPEGPNDQDGAPGLDLNEEPVEEASDEVGAPRQRNE